MPNASTDRTGRERRSKAAGDRFESVAERYLNGRGLATVRRNYSCRAGEIDLVMRDGDTFVFVEVRYRRSRGFGGAAASVTRGKQKKLVATARHYLLSLHRVTEPPCRFDVVALGGDPAKPDIDWIAGAFSA